MEESWYEKTVHINHINDSYKCRIWPIPTQESASLDKCVWKQSITCSSSVKYSRSRGFAPVNGVKHQTLTEETWQNNFFELEVVQQGRADWKHEKKKKLCQKKNYRNNYSKKTKQTWISEGTKGLYLIRWTQNASGKNILFKNICSPFNMHGICGCESVVRYE